MLFYCPAELLQHQQHLVLYCRRHLDATCLQAVYPQVHFLGLHGVEHLSELLDLLLGILLLLLALEPVEFLVVEVETLVVISLVADSVLSATYSVNRCVVMVVLVGDWCVLAELLEQQEACDEECQYGNQYDCVHLFRFYAHRVGGLSAKINN